MLRARALPSALLNVICAMYTSNFALFPSPEGALEFLFWIFSGVVQGCPLSGSLFALAMDPFLCLFDNIFFSRDKGVVRACADDIGAAFKSINELHNCKGIFTLAKIVSK